jgi:AcrR family transcriptional regulator
MPRRSSSDVADTRAAVVDAAVRQASVDGLEGLTIGRLADRVGMSKSGLHGLFGSKQDLQLAALRAAVDDFVHEVWEPVAGEPPGRARLLALCDSWLDYHARGVLPGGCFLTTASVEFDARPGPLRDAAALTIDLWLKRLAHEATTAVAAGELPPDTDADDVAFELNALASAASWNFHLSGDQGALDRARRLMRRTLNR